MDILDEIASAWGWMGVRPREIIMQNAFGNVIFTDEDGQYWRICPEELSCEVIATDGEQFARVQNSDSFLRDWIMQALVEQASSTLGNLSSTTLVRLVEWNWFQSRVISRNRLKTFPMARRSS
jgi:hypothetical protein